MESPNQFQRGSFDFQQQRQCLTCENVFHGKYCNVCGEKIIEPKDKSIKEFFGSVVNAFTFLEGKFLRSFLLMVRAPGKFSRYYAQGIRQRYMKPVSLFFVANFIFFFVPFVTSNTFSTPLQYQTGMPLFGKVAERMIEKKQTSENITFDALALQYKAQSDALAKLLIVINVLLFAIPLAIINYNKKLYFADHLYLSFEFYTHFLFVNMILVSIVVGGFLVMGNVMEFDTSYINDRFFSRLFLAINFYFFVRAIREFYQQKWWVAAIKSVALVLCVGYVMFVYKALLFFISMWMI